MNELNSCEKSYNEIACNRVFGIDSVEELSEVKNGAEILLYLQYLVSNCNYLNKIYTRIKKFSDSDLEKEYRVLLASKLLFIYRSKQRPFELKLRDKLNLELIRELNLNREKIDQRLKNICLNKHIVERLDGYKLYNYVS
jgi:hypothetical protein